MQWIVCLAATTHALQPPPSPRRVLATPRGAASRDLAAAAEAVEHIWQYEFTKNGPARMRMTREQEATHAKLWNQQDWEQHTRRDRWLQVLLTWPWSKLARGVAPTVALLMGWSVVVFQQKLKITANGLGFLASPIGLLLAFRARGGARTNTEAATRTLRLAGELVRLAVPRGARDVGQDDLPRARRRVDPLGVAGRRRRDARVRSPRGCSSDESRRRRGREMDSPWTRVAATPRPRAVDTSLGDAATRIVRGDGSRRRRGREPWTRVAATPRRG